MKKIIGLLMGLLLVFAVSGSASATVIDFTDGTTWGGANGNSTFSAVVEGINVTLNGSRASIFGRVAANMTWQADGLGIENWLGEDDEIDYLEHIKVSFAPNVIVNSLSFYDVDRDESATYILEGGNWVTTGGSLGATSLFTVQTGSADEVSWVTASADGGFLWADNVSLAKIDVTAPVPEPATMLLFGIGLLSLAGFSRKK